MLKNRNISRFIWVLGIYLILGIILYLVVVYKVKWQDLDLNTYLYFYNCDGNLCTSSIEQEKYYNKILCENDICPYITEKYNNYVILSKEDNKSYIYDYINNKVVYNKYESYKFSTDKKTIICRDSDNFYYVIDFDNKILVDAYNKEIDDYKDGYFSFIDNYLYGVANLEKNIKIYAKYDDLILANTNTYAFLEDNKYYIFTYNDEDTTLSYNYIYSFGNYLVVINNKKIDILDENLQSKLIMKIDTEYEYTNKKERESLNLNYDGKYLTFNVYTTNETIKYIYDIKNNKLLS